MERSVVALTSSSVNEEAYSEIQTQLDTHEASPKLIVFFSEIDMLWFFSQKLQAHYPDAVVIGSSTYVNYTSEGYSHGGASVLAVNSGIEVSAGLLFDINRHPSMYKEHIKNALDKLSSYENTCCLEFMTSFGKGEELVLDTFEEVLGETGITVAGGSAGALPDRKETYVALNGEIYKQTCAFVFIHNLNGKIGFYRENIFKPTSFRFTVTYADCEERTVMEYDGEPAAEIISRALNISQDDLKNELSLHPMGRIVDGSIYITEANEVLDDGSISYYATIYNHTKLLLLETDNIRRVWNETVQRVKNDIEEPSFTISINCLSRSKMFEKDSSFGEFVNVLRNHGKYIGVSGYGEQLNFIHLNQTMILVVFE